MTEDELIEVMARSDAEYDGRPFDGLGRADKERYLSRCRKSFSIARPVIREQALREAAAIAAFEVNPRWGKGDAMNYQAEKIAAAIERLIGEGK